MIVNTHSDDEKLNFIKEFLTDKIKDDPVFYTLSKFPLPDQFRRVYQVEKYFDWVFALFEEAIILRKMNTKQCIDNLLNMVDFYRINLYQFYRLEYN